MKAVLTSAFLLAALVRGAPLRSFEAKRSLPPKHLKNGLQCADCHHQEDPTKAAASDDSCVPCHGDYPAMAAYTRNLPVNPHNPPARAGHPAFLCTECHHQHRPAEVTCLTCHQDFKLKAV